MSADFHGLSGLSSEHRDSGNFFKKFLPRPDVFQISSIIFFTILNIVFLVIASQKNGFSFTESDVLFYFSVKILFDAAFLLFSVLILKAVFRTAFFSALFITANATLAISNILLYTAPTRTSLFLYQTQWSS